MSMRPRSHGAGNCSPVRAHARGAFALISLLGIVSIAVRTGGSLSPADPMIRSLFLAWWRVLQRLTNSAQGRRLLS